MNEDLFKNLINSYSNHYAEKNAVIKNIDVFAILDSHLEKALLDWKNGTRLDLDKIKNDAYYDFVENKKEFLDKDCINFVVRKIFRHHDMIVDKIYDHFMDEIRRYREVLTNKGIFSNCYTKYKPAISQDLITCKSEIIHCLDIFFVIHIPETTVEKELFRQFSANQIDLKKPIL